MIYGNPIVIDGLFGVSIDMEGIAILWKTRRFLGWFQLSKVGILNGPEHHVAEPANIYTIPYYQIR